MELNPVSIIKKKRDGNSLSQVEIQSLVDGYTKGEIPDYQMSSFLMSVYFQGMNNQETAHFTESMLHSGQTVDLSKVRVPKIDKHSTGGVGDKASIVIAPLLASVGVAVPMISGRGLGHTGGTSDKLEAIPGFNVNIPLQRFQELVSTTGIGLITQTKDICPADKKIYGLRDVTGTVPSIPLIVASIMSKKIAEDLDGLVLDIKCGNGAFMKSTKEAKKLAEALVGTAKHAKKKVRAILTDMSQPLGHAVGNSIEVNECISILRQGPQDPPAEPRLKELCLQLSIEMYLIAQKLQKKKCTNQQARKTLEEALDSGRAYAKFLEIVSLQGGDTCQLDEGLPLAPHKTSLKAKKNGYIHAFDTEAIGMELVELKGGRRTMKDQLDHSTGFYFHKFIGDSVKKGDILVDIYCQSKSDANRSKVEMENAIRIQSKKVSAPRLIRGRF